MVGTSEKNDEIIYDLYDEVFNRSTEFINFKLCGSAGCQSV